MITYRDAEAIFTSNVRPRVVAQRRSAKQTETRVTLKSEQVDDGWRFALVLLPKDLPATLDQDPDPVAEWLVGHVDGTGKFRLLAEADLEELLATEP